MPPEPEHPPALPRVYCAGPLFNAAERDEMTAIAERLEAAGFPVFLPHRDGMEFRRVHQVLIDRDWSPDRAGEILHAAIFALDVYQLAEECGAMVWNLNGRVPDEGAVSEAAIAWTLGKPLVAYSDDVRSLIAGRLNPLLAGLVGFRVVRSIGELPARLSAAIASGNHSHRRPFPPNLQTIVEPGKRLWKAMSECDEPADDERIADLVVNLFASRSEVSSPQVS